MVACFALSFALLQRLVKQPNDFGDTVLHAACRTDFEPYVHEVLHFCASNLNAGLVCYRRMFWLKEIEKVLNVTL